MNEIRVLSSKHNTKESEREAMDCSQSSTTWSFFGIVGGGGDSSKCKTTLANRGDTNHFGIDNRFVYTIGSKPYKNYYDWAQQSNTPEVLYKEVAPISDLFIAEFMGKLATKEGLDLPQLKTFLEKKIRGYCALYGGGRCSFVTRMTYSMQDCPKLQYITEIMQ